MKNNNAIIESTIAEILAIGAKAGITLEFLQNYTGGDTLQDLESVLTTGEISTKNITTQGYTSSGTRAGGDLKVIIGDYDDSSEGTKITIDDGAAEVTVKTDDLFLALGGQLALGNSLGKYIYIDTENVVNDIILETPTISGTIALLSDITVGGVGTLQQSTDLGNTTTTDIRSYTDVNTYSELKANGSIYLSDGPLNFMNVNPTLGQVTAYVGTANQSKLQFPAATGAWVYTLPQQSGTIALLSDVSGGDNLQKEITISYTIANADNNYTLLFNSATPITITLNTLTTANFECSFYNKGAGLVSFVQGTVTTLTANDGLTLPQGKVGAMIKYQATDELILKGEFE